MVEVENSQIMFRAIDARVVQQVRPYKILRDATQVKAIACDSLGVGRVGADIPVS